MSFSTAASCGGEGTLIIDPLQRPWSRWSWSLICFQFVLSNFASGQSTYCQTLSPDMEKPEANYDIPVTFLHIASTRTLTEETLVKLVSTLKWRLRRQSSAAQTVIQIKTVVISRFSRLVFFATRRPAPPSLSPSHVSFNSAGDVLKSHPHGAVEGKSRPPGLSRLLKNDGRCWREAYSTVSNTTLTSSSKFKKNRLL